MYLSHYLSWLMSRTMTEPCLILFKKVTRGALKLNVHEFNETQLGSFCVTLLANKQD